MDGEGTITVHRQSRKNRHFPAYRSYVGVSNTKREPLEIFKMNYGGKIYFHPENRRTTRPNKRWADAYTWYCPVSSSKKILGDILPFLVVKRSQAKIALEFVQHVTALDRTLIRDARNGRYIGAQHLTKEELSYREGLRLKMRLLNKKGKRIC